MILLEAAVVLDDDVLSGARFAAPQEHATTAAALKAIVATAKLTTRVLITMNLQLTTPVEVGIGRFDCDFEVLVPAEDPGRPKGPIAVGSENGHLPDRHIVSQAPFESLDWSGLCNALRGNGGVQVTLTGPGRQPPDRSGSPALPGGLVPPNSDDRTLGHPLGTFPLTVMRRGMQFAGCWCYGAHTRPASDPLRSSCFVRYREASQPFPAAGRN